MMRVKIVVSIRDCMVLVMILQQLMVVYERVCTVIAYMHILYV